MKKDELVRSIKEVKSLDKENYAGTNTDKINEIINFILDNHSKFEIDNDLYNYFSYLTLMESKYLTGDKRFFELRERLIDYIRNIITHRKLHL